MISTPLLSVYREQLTEMLAWYRDSLPRFRWGAVLHLRRERGRDRFGVVTLGGESLLLSAPLVARLHDAPVWLDGAVRVRFRDMSPAPDHLLAQLRRDGRAPLVERLAMTFDTIDADDETALLASLAGEFTPQTLPGELFLLASRRPAGWPA